MANKTEPIQLPVHHYARTILAAIFGSLALLLIVDSILVVWADRTLTDTPTYVKTVAPLIKKPAIKVYITQKVTDQLIKSAPTQDLAVALLPAPDVMGKSAEELKQSVTPIIKQSVMQLVNSSNFQNLWKSTVELDHDSFIRQLESNSPQITVDFGSFVTGITQQLKDTKLAPVSANIDLQPETAKLTIKGDQIKSIHKAYTLFKTASVAILVITVLFIALSVLISVHHAKTLRRILTATGVVALILAALITVPSLITFHSGDVTEWKAVTAVVTTLLHNLQVAFYIIGVVCLLGAFGSKIYAKRSH